jgi:hypothetical protein
MKKLTSLWMMILMLCMSIPAMGAMGMSKVRENARFLTDRMAYELKLTPMQYDDVYEVNFDFIDNVRHIMDDVVRGYDHAVDRYYQFLDYRNDDLRWILSASQYRRFMGVDYFYRPIYTTTSNWLFRIYKVYRNVNHFYFDKPHHYKNYRGGHYRTHHGHVSFYKNNRKEHYKHDFYKGDIRTRHDKPKAVQKVERHPKGNSRPAPNRKEVKSSEVKRTSDIKRSSESTVRRSAKEKKEVRKDSQPNRSKGGRKEVKKENKPKNENLIQNSRGENQEGRRAKR